MASGQAEEWAAEEGDVAEDGEHSRPRVTAIIMMRNYV